MKPIRAAVPNDDDCLRYERILDDAGLPFDLNSAAVSGKILSVISQNSRYTR
jgi:hypothetical protein